MPAEFEKILSGVKRNLKGKKNPRTKKPYTESEMYAIATAQYKKTKKSFSVMAPITKYWEEDVTIEKSPGKTEKSKQRFMEVTVSGLKEDRDDERFSQEAIDDMLMQFKSQTIPFFPDHGRDDKTGMPNVYSWKQMMGVWVDARQENEKLMATIRLNNAHPDHDMFWGFVKEGMPIGFSIGGRPVDEPTVIEEEIPAIEQDTNPELEKKNEKKN